MAELRERLKEKYEYVRFWVSKHKLPCLCFFFLLLSFTKGVFVINWNDSCSVITDMWRANSGVGWVQGALIDYSDIIVAVTASIIVALLSITITMYVFLKSAMDRIIDENPYITPIARIYQDETSDNLLWTTLCSICPLLLVLGWYSILRFQPILNERDYRNLIIGIGSFCVSLFVAIAITAKFWSCCLGMRKRLSQLIGEKKEEFSEQLGRVITDQNGKYFLIGYWSEWETSAADDIIAKKGGKFPEDIEILQKNNEEIITITRKGKSLCDDLTADQFINLFSRIEVLLMSGVGGVDSSSIRKYNESDIITVIQERSDISAPTIEVEEKDLQDREYRGDEHRRVLEYINSFRTQIGFSLDSEKKPVFFRETKQLYLTLKAYRDLLISERYVNGSKNRVKEDCEELNKLDDMMGLGMYFFFLRVLALFVSAVNIKEFTFNGNVLNFANFYNSTLTNVSFYSSQFYHTIFARAKLLNVTMDLSEIDNVFFYYTKLSNTSLSNTNFSNVDFENIQMQDCDLSICNFTNCKIKNSSLRSTIFNGSSFCISQLEASDFSYSKLWNVTLNASSITDCDFTGTEIQNWMWGKSNGEVCIKNCNFSSSVWDNTCIIRADLSQAVFDDASLISMCFAEAKLEEALFRRCQLAQTEFVHCEKLSQSSFQDANLFGAVFTKCTIDRSSFFRANASYARFEHCSIKNGDCAEAYFRSAALIETRFDNTRLYNATFDWAKIEGCNFTNTLADHVQFTSAISKDSYFNYASMTESSFSGSFFENCDFTGADLSESAATKLTLQQCMFCQTDLSHAKIVDCVFDSTKNPVINCIFTSSKFAGVSGGKFSCVTFDNCAFDQTDFSNWEFFNVKFLNCYFEGSVFSKCQFQKVTFDNCTVGQKGNEHLLTERLLIRNHIRPHNKDSGISEHIFFPKKSKTIMK